LEGGGKGDKSTWYRLDYRILILVL
jgi:hypothetical protein